MKKMGDFAPKFLYGMVLSPGGKYKGKKKYVPIFYLPPSGGK